MHGSTPKVTSLLNFAEGQELWLVRYHDNSDYGIAEEFYDTESDARARAEALTANPPGGNAFHPAPATLDIRMFAIRRLSGDPR